MTGLSVNRYSKRVNIRITGDVPEPISKAGRILVKTKENVMRIYPADTNNGLALVSSDVNGPRKCIWVTKPDKVRHYGKFAGKYETLHEGNGYWYVLLGEAVTPATDTVRSSKNATNSKKKEPVQPEQDPDIRKIKSVERPEPHDCALRIVRYKRSNGKHILHVRIRDLPVPIKNAGYVAFEGEKDRLWIIPSTKNVGWHPTGDRLYLQNPDAITTLTPFEGEYPQIHFDVPSGKYYVDKAEAKATTVAEGLSTGRTFTKSSGTRNLENTEALDGGIKTAPYVASIVVKKDNDFGESVLVTLTKLPEKICDRNWLTLFTGSKGQLYLRATPARLGCRVSTGGPSKRFEITDPAKIEELRPFEGTYAHMSPTDDPNKYLIEKEAPVVPDTRPETAEKGPETAATDKPTATPKKEKPTMKTKTTAKHTAPAKPVDTPMPAEEKKSGEEKVIDGFKEWIKESVDNMDFEKTEKLLGMMKEIQGM